MYDYAGDSLSQVRIAHEPAAWCDSVGFVVKLLRPQLVEVAESSRKHTHIYAAYSATTAESVFKVLCSTSPVDVFMFYCSNVFCISRT